MFNIQEYSHSILPVSKYPHAGEKNLGALDYCVKGLNGETGETCEKMYNRPTAIVSIGDSIDPNYCNSIMLELGDVLWYIVRTMEESCINFSEVSSMKYPANGDSPERAALLLAAQAGRVAEILKKASRDEGLTDTDVLPETRRASIAESLSSMIATIEYIARCYGSTLDEVADKNVHKVLSRLENGTLGGDGDHR